MDWYYGSVTDDLIVPKDQELSDNIFSPDSWLNYELSDPESYQALEKCFAFDPKFTKEESSYNDGSLFNEVEMEDSVHDKNHSRSSSVCEGWSTDSDQQKYLSCDYQLDGLDGFEQMDDIFLYSVTSVIMKLDLMLHYPLTYDDENLTFPGFPECRNSLLEDIPQVGIQGKPLCSKPRSGMTQSDNLLRDISFGYHCNSNTLHSVGSPKHTRAHATSSSVGSQEDLNASEFTACNSNQNYRLPMKNGDGVSLEETVLQELKMVMDKFTEKSRLCFRDSFYRLAKNSKECYISQNKDGDYLMETDPPSTGHADIMRSDTQKVAESETNTIDRAIANMMFNNKFTQSSTHQLNQHHIQPNDFEVPIFSRGDLYATTNVDTSLSRNAAECKYFVLDFGSSGG